MNNFGTTIRTTTSTRTRKTSQLRNLELIKIRVGENHLLWSSTRRTCSAKLNAQKVTMNTAKDLTKEPPRSLCERIGGYAVLAPMADKGRATLTGTAGEYHFNCPLDNMLFTIKGVQAEDVKNLLASGATDERVAPCFTQNSIPK